MSRKRAHSSPEASEGFDPDKLRDQMDFAGRGDPITNASLERVRRLGRNADRSDCREKISDLRMTVQYRSATDEGKLALEKQVGNDVMTRRIRKKIDVKSKVIRAIDEARKEKLDQEIQSFARAVTLSTEEIFDAFAKLKDSPDTPERRATSAVAQPLLEPYVEKEPDASGRGKHHVAPAGPHTTEEGSQDSWSTDDGEHNQDPVSSENGEDSQDSAKPASEEV